MSASTIITITKVTQAICDESNPDADDIRLASNGVGALSDTSNPDGNPDCYLTEVTSVENAVSP